MSQLICVCSSQRSQIICTEKGHVSRVRPSIIVRRYTYLIWIGLRTVQAARRDGATVLGEGETEPPSLGPSRAFREGVLVEALNPKTAAFFLAFVPQFVEVGAGSVALQFIVLGSVSVVLNTSADVVVAFAAGRIRAGASARPVLIRRLRVGSGAAMIALGLGLALAKRPTT